MIKESSGIVSILFDAKCHISVWMKIVFDNIGIEFHNQPFRLTKYI